MARQEGEENSVITPILSNDSKIEFFRFKQIGEEYMFLVFIILVLRQLSHPVLETGLPTHGLGELHALLVLVTPESQIF